MNSTILKIDNDKYEVYCSVEVQDCKLSDVESIEAIISPGAVFFFIGILIATWAFGYGIGFINGKYGN